MKRNRWFPSRISQQVIFLINYADKVGAYGTATGMDANATLDTVADARWLVYVLGSWLTDVRTFSGAATNAIDVAMYGQTGGSSFPMPTFTAPALPTTPVPPVVARPAGGMTRILDYIAQLKLRPGYDEPMGIDLGVIGSEDTADHPTPEFSLELAQGSGCQCVMINFTKFSHQGVYIECRRNGGPYELAAIDTEKPYVDERPLLDPTKPEIREYRLRFWDKGTPNGPWSEVQKITVSP